MPSNLVAASKFLSLVLRHQPDLLGLELLEDGWVPVDELLEAAGKHGKSIPLSLLQEVVRTSDKQRFSFSPDGSLVRANQGHSFPVSIAFERAPPPDVLFHGTAIASLQTIRLQGLRRMRRHHVHLSADVATATRVGMRHGQAVVLTVDARAMSSDGFAFFLSANGVWLTDAVPGAYLTILP